MKFSIGRKSTILMGSTFDVARNLCMGDHSVINQECRLDTRGGITIGANVSISASVVILTADHDVNSDDFAYRSKPVTIEDYVFVGTRAMILPGVKLGRGCVVAAGAVVTKDVPENTIVAGTPAREIGTRNSRLEYQLDFRPLFS
jgi:acetyltransferase-like isoleucine patch superfamily enzyme